MRKQSVFCAGLLVGILAVSCTRETETPDAFQQGQMPILLSGSIEQQFTTRATDSGFADGDAIGIYVVDYQGDTPGTLLASGNHADNLRHVFDEAAGRWIPDRDIFWVDKRTHIDIYGYYPYIGGYPDAVQDLSFEVRADQNAEASNGGLGGYEASDFLWGKSEDNAPTDRTIALQMHHIMAGVRVSLVQGSGFGSGEWSQAEKAVLLPNLIRTAAVDLRTGAVTPTGTKSEQSTVAARMGTDWRAILVPQTVPAGQTLFTITVGGIPYSVTRSDAFTFAPSKLHNFTYAVNKRSDTGGLELVLRSESITAWENDTASHDATAREYVVINLTEAGNLENAIASAGKDLAKIRNLKVTGQIDARDFAVMRDRMPALRAINLKEVRIMAWDGHEADAIPMRAFSGEMADNGKKSLVSFIFPDRLRKIGERAFSGCTNLSGSLILPEGLQEIGVGAFFECGNLSGQLVLPSTLEVLGRTDAYSPYWEGVFVHCGFTSEVKLPESLRVIGCGAFYYCSDLYGELHLPDGLEQLGSNAFEGCANLTGSLVVPQKLTSIPAAAFNGLSGMKGTLTLHDGIKFIGDAAFTGSGFRGELRLPSRLEMVGRYVFKQCDFSGTLVLPKSLRAIGEEAFAYNWRLMGTLEIPESVVSVGPRAFAGCSSLEGVIFPEGLESIRDGAFSDCFGIGRLVCHGEEPPIIQGDPFSGVPKDNFTLEVPVSSVISYKAAPGWKDFKRIAAYRNFVVRPSLATAINTSVTRDLVLTADEPWLVESKPDWITLDKTSGDGKCELKLTFSQMAHGTASREGEVVFKMRDRDYRTRCKVSQYDYSYAEDEIITLQSATRGKGINIVLLGDGFNAKDIQDGKLLETATEAAEHFFGLEPYKTYRDYFNVYTAVSVSPESGVGGVNTIVYNRFNTSAKGGVTLSGRNGDSDFEMIRAYACKAPTVNSGNISEALIIMLPNTSDYGGICYWFPDGLSIAYCPKSDYGYPLDFRGVI